MDYRKMYERWIESPALDAESRNELLSLHDEKEIEDRFYMDLEFGTAGLRGVLGAGMNRMNEYVVKRATQGFAQYICSMGAKAAARGVAIAYDSRHKSDVFAKTAALVLCANGINVYLYESLRSVPQLSFTILQCNAAAGIVITASHNPPQYNGYKVYGENGGQLPIGPSEEVTALIGALDIFDERIRSMNEQEALASGLLHIIGEEFDKLFDACVRSVSIQPKVLAQADFKVVYTPLHGAGLEPVCRALNGIGFKNLLVVEEQKRQDGSFHTVKVPNPEEKEAYELAIRLAKKEGAYLVLATDPDSDRLGVGVLDDALGFTLLSGNQIGCLLLEYILSQRAQKGALPQDAFAVKSIVSTRMANAIAARYGVQLDEVLTGFRFISDKIEESMRPPKRAFLFGFEESFGFLAGTYARDKDAVGAAVLMCEVAAYYAGQGMTLLDALGALYEQYGYYKEAVLSYTLTGKEGIVAVQKGMAALRENALEALGGVMVTGVCDYLAGTRVHDGMTYALSLPQSDVMYYEMARDCWAAVRPSGTEPKLKAYVGICGEDEEDACDMLSAVKEELSKILQGHLGIE
ncbi:MAG: phospho-sugar mutase [Christensenellales bacterium]|jgi:phosphoglucomutase